MHTAGWVNYANECSQAALERSSQDAYDVTALTEWWGAGEMAVWTVDDVARLIKFFFKFLFILKILHSVAYDSER